MFFLLNNPWEDLFNYISSAPGLPNVSVYLGTLDLISYIVTFANYFLPIDTVTRLISLTFGFLVLRGVIAFIRFIIHSS